MIDSTIGMFKLYDIRTKKEKLSDENASRLYDAVACYYKDYVKAGSVVIGRDARLYVPQVADGLVKALREASIDVILNPLPISTCQFYYTCMVNPDSAGIMVTASHNPMEYVGLKLLSVGVKPIAYGCGLEGGIEKIKELYIEGRKAEKGKMGKLRIVNELDSFIDYSMKLAKVGEGDLKGMRILIETLNGSAGTELALAFQKAGADVEMRNVIPNGFFPHGDPNPIIESSIAPAREAMRSGKWDIGFCFDGDGDRMDLMASNGEQIVPGLNMSIIVDKLMAIYNGEKKSFYADVKAIPLSLCEIAKKGVDVHIIRNGHSFIKEKLNENCAEGYFASEEESAHYYMNFPLDIAHPEKGYAAVENTLFFALVTALSYKENREAYRRAYELQTSLYREREWPLYFEDHPEKMEEIMKEVEERMIKEGASVIKRMDDGDDLDATLMRFNLPLTFDSSSTLDGKVWAQVAERISRSEDAMCRWEVVSNDRGECERLNGIVRTITDRYVDAGYARY